MRIGVIQSKNRPGIENVPYNREMNGKDIEVLFKKGTDLVVLPEFSNHQYTMKTQEEVELFSEHLNDQSVSFWSQLASSYGKYIVGAILERDGEAFYNTAVLVGPKGYIGHYRKVHLFDWENDYLTKGNLGFPTFTLPESDIKRGMLICYDLRFPEAVRSLAIDGCDVLLVPTTWTSIGKKNLWDKNGYCSANYAAIAHTYSNRMAIACSDRVGEENNVTYLGASLIVNSASEVVAGPASTKDAERLMADIDPVLSRNKNIGTKSNLLQDRRPDMYTMMV